MMLSKRVQGVHIVGYMCGRCAALNILTWDWIGRADEVEHECRDCAFVSIVAVPELVS